MNKKVKQVYNLNTEDIEKELSRVKKKRRRRVDFYDMLRLIVVSAAFIIVLTNIFFPIYSVSGDSMNPTLADGDICLFYKTTECEAGDIVTFYNNGDTLIKRVIAVGGDVVDIKDDGTIYINGKMLKEGYISDKSIGYCTITLPCVVPEGEVFVMGDNRSNSLDSRSASVGCIGKERLVGRMIVSSGYLRELVSR